MAGCGHEGFHSAASSYDVGLGVLVFVVVCDRCGAPLRELHREDYRPEAVLRTPPPSRDNGTVNATPGA